MILTNSELQAWKHCPRCWYLGYYLKLRKVRETKSTLTVGSLYHRGLEIYYREGIDPVDYIKARAVSFINENPDAAADILKDTEMAGIMVEGYMEWLAETGADADLEVYATEAKMRVTVFPSGYDDGIRSWPDGLDLLGKLDARAYLRSSGARLFLEHKTCQSLKDLPKTAQTNHQFLTYCLLELLGDVSEHERCDGVLLNMGRKCKRTARANPPFYDRHEVRFNTAELRNHWKHVVGTADDIQRAIHRLDSGEDIAYVVPPTTNRDCAWRCGFSSVCQDGMMDDGSDWKGYLREFFEEVDPLARYDDDEDYEEGGE